MNLVTRAVLGVALLAACARADDGKPQTGPETEKRFPPLKVSAGFKATLFACDPLIEYPSAIALGPKPQSLFVAVDYMTGLGTEIVRRDEIRLIEDTDADGYADKATVYASGFNSIEGMTFHDGVVYAMHSPLLTALSDTDGDGVADERRDLLTGLGLAPEDNPPRLHCANGIVWGYDGWLYLALGDHGCDVPRPEGDRLVFNGGGILRCRTDGRDLHVFSTGLRNIYDVALDEDLNVFVRDNENDGGDYKIRVCHSFFGADHGYPYLYYERPDEALPPLADLGLGSSAGGACYLETQFPPEYRGNLFFCEWGRAVMRYVPERTGGGFASIKEIEFAAGAENDPYGFKPTDIVVDRDGSLLVADWCDGQRPKRGRGRIYRVTYAGEKRRDRGANPHGETLNADRSLKEWLRLLDSESYAERVAAQVAIEKRGRDGIEVVRSSLRAGRLGVRGRLHAVWILAHSEPPAALTDLAGQFAEPRRDPDPRVRAQAIRAIADLTDPMLTRHRLHGPGGSPIANWVVTAAEKDDPTVRLQALTCLARLHRIESPDAIERLVKHDETDATLAHAALHALRNSQDWPAVLRLLDEPSDNLIRSIVLRAVAERTEIDLVDGLIDRLRTESQATRRREYADVLTRVHKKPGPWTYWGYRPPPRPANTVEWERTLQIKQTVNAMLLDPDRTVRLAVLRRMQREKIPTIPDTIEAWLMDERDSERVAAIIESLREHRPSLVRDMLLAMVRESEHATANRLSALAQLADGLDEESESCLTELAGVLEAGPILAAALRQIGKRPRLAAESLLVGELNSPSADVRAAAVDALAERRVRDAGASIRPLLDDPDAGVRRAAAAAAGKLRITFAADPLVKLAADGDAAVQRASLESLRQLGDSRVLSLAIPAVNHAETQLTALACIGEFGSPDHTRLVVENSKRHPSAATLREAAAILTRWRTMNDLSAETRDELDLAVAELHGSSGVLAQWHTLGPVPAGKAAEIAQASNRPGQQLLEPDDQSAQWKTELPSSTDSNFSLNLGKTNNPTADSHWLGLSDVWVAERGDVQFLSSSNGAIRVWLNGRSIFERPQPAAFQPDSDRFNATLSQGPNRLIVQVSASESPIFHLRFRQKSSRAEHEQLVQSALARSGNAERGRKLFFDAEKSQCIKCHRLDDQGERIGPELTGVGNRFSRIHIIESILEPSRTLAPSYESVTIALADGRVLNGLRVAETDTEVTVVDNQVQKHVVAKSDIEEMRKQSQSVMPDGLEKRFTMEEFVDLIAFLVTQKESR